MILSNFSNVSRNVSSFNSSLTFLTWKFVYNLFFPPNAFCAFFAWNEATNGYFFAAQQHVDRCVCRFLRSQVNKLFDKPFRRVQLCNSKYFQYFQRMCRRPVLLSMFLSKFMIVIVIVIVNARFSQRWITLWPLNANCHQHCIEIHCTVCYFREKK